MQLGPAPTLLLVGFLYLLFTCTYQYRSALTGEGIRPRKEWGFSVHCHFWTHPFPGLIPLLPCSIQTPYCPHSSSPSSQSLPSVTIGGVHPVSVLCGPAAVVIVFMTTIKLLCYWNIIPLALMAKGLDNKSLVFLVQIVGGPAIYLSVMLKNQWEAGWSGLIYVPLWFRLWKLAWSRAMKLDISLNPR